MKRGSLKKWQFSRVLQLHSSSHSNQRRWWFSEIALFLYCENVKKRSYSIEKPVENNPLMTRILGWGSQWNTCSQRIGIFYGHDMRLPFQMQRLNESKPETVQSLRSHTSKDINPNVCLSNTRGGLMWKTHYYSKNNYTLFLQKYDESIIFSGSEMSLMKIEIGHFFNAPASSLSLWNICIVPTHHVLGVTKTWCGIHLYTIHWLHHCLLILDPP